MSLYRIPDSYEAAERYILDIPKFTVKNSMADTRCFLRHLNCSEYRCKTIHIAGTNGKGSVCAYLCSILREAGFHTGMFVSPHLVSMRERFVIDGEIISEEEFLEAAGEVAEKLSDLPKELACKNYHPTFFEYLFFMAMLLFAKHEVDYMVLETGLGGRLDATNAIDDKDVCVITSIGYDHMEYLGETLPEIAKEKAGIFREGVPVVYFNKCTEVTETLEKCAIMTKSPTFPVLFSEIKETNSGNKTIDFSLQSNYYGYIRFRMSTMALYQIENAALAVRAIELLDDRKQIDIKALTEGIFKMRWEGRMEEILPSVYLDGAHNTDGIGAFLQTVKTDGCTGKRRLLFSMVKEKQYKEVIQMLTESELFDEVGLVALQDKRALPLEELAYSFGQYTKAQIRKYDRLEKAMRNITAGLSKADRVYIVGSLYLAGEVKALLRRQLHD